MLCQLPRQGSVDREIQELVYHGRTRVLPAQDLPLEWSEARPTRTFPRPYPFEEEGEEPEQPRSALCWEWIKGGRTDRRSVITAQFILLAPTTLSLLSLIPVLHIAPILAAAVQKSATPAAGPYLTRPPLIIRPTIASQ